MNERNCTHTYNLRDGKLQLKQGKMILCVLLVSSEIIHNQCEQCESLFGSTADLDSIPHPGTTNCTNMS